MSKYTTLMKVYLFRDVSEVMLAGREASPRVHKDQLSPATFDKLLLSPCGHQPGVLFKCYYSHRAES